LLYDFFALPFVLLPKVIFFVLVPAPALAFAIVLIVISLFPINIYDTKKVVDKIEGLPNDPTNINQYESIGQLFNAVKYFIEGSETTLLNKIKQFVSAGEAKVLYQDSEWIIYEPLTRDANTVFEKPLSTWCTAQPGNSYFNKYTSEDRQPDGKVSRIYDIVSKDALKGESNEIYQFHFESNGTNGQFKDYTNKDINVTEFWRRNHNITNLFKKISI
jgi:hypothetical protein